MCMSVVVVTKIVVFIDHDIFKLIKIGSVYLFWALYLFMATNGNERSSSTNKFRTLFISQSSCFQLFSSCIRN